MRLSFLLLLFTCLAGIVPSCKKSSPTPPSPVVVPKVAGVTTTVPSNITRTSFQVGATVSSDGGATVTTLGLCYSTSPNPTTANTTILSTTGNSIYFATIASLTPNTTYYVKAYAINSVGISYGSEVVVTTPPLSVPVVNTTATVSTLTPFTTIASGKISDDGGLPVTTRGMCWSNSHTPTIADLTTANGSGTGSFNSQLTTLNGNTTYYIRAYATNSLSTGYGEMVTIVTDIEGNVYNSLKIGTQTWMLENLKTTKYNTGVSIPLVTADAAWSNYSVLPTPMFCWYGNNSGYKDIYGALYNWLAVNTGQLAPVGWHVPTHTEFATFIQYLDPVATSETVLLFGTDPYTSFHSTVLGGKMKETGFAHWQTPNLGATNESGFTAVGAGLRQDLGGNFDYLNQFGGWWCTTQIQANNSYRLIIAYSSAFLAFYGPEGIREGLSVRCIKD